VDDLVDHLEAAGYQADRLHGDMTQNMRDRVMNKFRQSGLEFLVATDVAARGIDVDDVEVVFNFDLPYDVEDYVHRIGRTGRAGKSGRAISLVPFRELFQIRNIERFANVRIQRGKVPTVDEVAEAKENVFLDKLRAQLKSGAYTNYEHLLERLLEEGFNSSDVASALIHQLQSGEAARNAPRVEEYDRPQREERPGHSDDRRERAPQRDDRRGRSNDRDERGFHDPRRPRFEGRRDDRSPRPGAPGTAPARRESEIKRATPATAVPKQPKPVVSSPSASEKPAIEKVPETAPVISPQLESKPEIQNPEIPKTYSDEEILASVQNPVPKPESKLFVKSKSAPAAAKTKVSRATPQGQTRLWMNLGETQEIKPIDIVNAVAGETGLPGKVVGTVDVREKHLFVDVASEHANGIIAKLNRAEIKGHKVKVKAA